MLYLSVGKIDGKLPVVSALTDTSVHRSKAPTSLVSP